MQEPAVPSCQGGYKMECTRKKSKFHMPTKAIKLFTYIDGLLRSMSSNLDSVGIVKSWHIKTNTAIEAEVALTLNTITRNATATYFNSLDLKLVALVLQAVVSRKVHIAVQWPTKVSLVRVL